METSKENVIRESITAQFVLPMPSNISGESNTHVTGTFGLILHIYRCIGMSVCIYLYTYTNTYIYIYIYIYIHVYVYIYAYINTYIHTYIRKIEHVCIHSYFCIYVL
jgi:hypothetical protein